VPVLYSILKKRAMIQNQESDSAEKLLIEDEVDLASMSAEALRTEIFTVEIAYNAEQAL